MYKILLLFPFLVFQTSIYTINYTAQNGSSVGFGSYEGKKILLVNIATNSPKVNQLGALEQLHQLYGDSLVVIAFPSNDFGNESRSDQEIKSFCENNYHTSFLLAQKGSVRGPLMQPVFLWLAEYSQNGQTSASVIGDFEKFLIDKDGSLIGIFAPSVSPLDSTIQSSITSTIH